MLCCISYADGAENTMPGSSVDVRLFVQGACCLDIGSATCLLLMVLKQLHMRVCSVWMMFA